MTEPESKKRLGRGLAALIGETDAADRGQSGKTVRPDRTVPIERLTPNPRNPRRDFDPDDLADLANSIKAHGVVQPILVRTARHSGDETVRYEIIAGERRWRAAQQARLHEVPILVRETSDRESLELAIIENVQRADLNAIEEAAGYQQLIDEHGYSQAELGNVLGKSRSHIANTIRLLKLPQAVRDMIANGELSAGHARTLITADDPLSVARRIVADGLSVRQAEALGKSDSSSEAGNRANSAPQHRDADINALEKRLEDKLGLKVTITHRPDGNGSVRIDYRDVDQLDGLCNRF